MRELSEEDGYSTQDMRELISILVNGLYHLHERDLVHGDVSTRNLVFTPPKLRGLSEQALIKLIEEPEKVPTKGILQIEDVEKLPSKRERKLPEFIVGILEPTDLMEFDHVPRIRAFPPMVKAGSKPAKRATYDSPESIFNKHRGQALYPADDV